MRNESQAHIWSIFKLEAIHICFVVQLLKDAKASEKQKEGTSAPEPEPAVTKSGPLVRMTAFASSKKCINAQGRMCTALACLPRGLMHCKSYCAGAGTEGCWW